MIKFKIPATSANIGPGFDCFGLAYSFYNEYSVEKADSIVEAEMGKYNIPGGMNGLF